MAMHPPVSTPVPPEWVKIHSLRSDGGRLLNGRTGKLTAYHWNYMGKKGNDRYEVQVGSRHYAINTTNLILVSEQWQRELRASAMRRSDCAIMENFDAPGFFPCSVRVLQDPNRNPSKEELLSWWGQSVFRYIRDRMETQRNHKGAINWAMDEAIKNDQLYLAMVNSTGTSRTMESREQCMWWPTIAFPLPTNWDGDWGSYCQGLALQDGASPWQVARSTLHLFGPCGDEPGVGQTGPASTRPVSDIHRDGPDRARLPEPGVGQTAPAGTSSASDSHSDGTSSEVHDWNMVD